MKTRVPDFRGRMPTAEEWAEVKRLAALAIEVRGLAKIERPGGVGIIGTHDGRFLARITDRSGPLFSWKRIDRGTTGESVTGTLNAYEYNDRPTPIGTVVRMERAFDDEFRFDDPRMGAGVPPHYCDRQDIEFRLSCCGSALRFGTGGANDVRLYDPDGTEIVYGTGKYDRLGFTVYRSGTYTYTTSFAGYIAQSGSITVALNCTTTYVDLSLRVNSSITVKVYPPCGYYSPDPQGVSFAEIQDSTHNIGGTADADGNATLTVPDTFTGCTIQISASPPYGIPGIGSATGDVMPYGCTPDGSASQILMLPLLDGYACGPCWYPYPRTLYYSDDWGSCELYNDPSAPNLSLAWVGICTFRITPGIYPGIAAADCPGTNIEVSVLIVLKPNGASGWVCRKYWLEAGCPSGSGGGGPADPGGTGDGDGGTAFHPYLTSYAGTIPTTWVEGYAPKDCETTYVPLYLDSTYSHYYDSGLAIPNPKPYGIAGRWRVTQ